MKILINEKQSEVDEISAFTLRDKIKKDADIVILNGFPIKQDMDLNEGDKITFIKRGEIPNQDELEALMVSRHTPLVHQALKKGRVAIAGIGGLGSNVAISLARVGVGYIKIIDFDIVEPSNLNRQQYFIDQIGMKKVEALKANLQRINPFIKIVTVEENITKENVENIFEDVDIIVEAFDNPVNKAMLVSEALNKFKDKKIVAASGMAGFHSNNLIQSKKFNSRLYICGDFVNEARVGEGLMAPRVGIAANHEANMVVRLLLNEEDV
jgi:sulfur carrier protein ThiS adenylyltransferase